MKGFKKIIACILLVSVMITSVSCQSKGKQQAPLEDFNQFVNEIFKGEVSSDTISLHYTLANPETYGIAPLKTSLGEFSIAQTKKDLLRSENYYNTLQRYDHDSLSTEDALIYDILSDTLSNTIKTGDYMYYQESLGPTTGIQAQLPILLAEYSFYTEEDIVTYLELLNCVDDYFASINTFEREKSEEGFFMTDKVADMIINQCKDFINKPEENLLITCFNEKIEEFNGLSEDQISKYEEDNKVAVFNSVIPAYASLITTLETLKGTSTNQIGLCGFDKGKQYYELMCQINTGSSKTIKEMKKVLESTMNACMLTMTTIQLQSPTIASQLDSFSFPATEPNEIITYLKEAIKKDFPPLMDVNCSVKYVHESLQDHLSPAMYLVPPIDYYNNNFIYINNNPDYDMSEIFPTVAHEGYPGHLYQNVYFRSLNPQPIRSIINVTGYDEGWATYVEAYSYELANLTPELKDMLVANMITLHCLYSLTDIGIHYEGWTKSDTADFWSVYGVDSEISEEIYYTILSEPGIYLPYSIGYIELTELKEKAKNALGTDFNLRDFHKFILTMGPAPFSVINKYMDKWLSKK